MARENDSKVNSFETKLIKISAACKTYCTCEICGAPTDTGQHICNSCRENLFEIITWWKVKKKYV